MIALTPRTADDLERARLQHQRKLALDGRREERYRVVVPPQRHGIKVASTAVHPTEERMADTAVRPTESGRLRIDPEARRGCGWLIALALCALWLWRGEVTAEARTADTAVRPTGNLAGSPVRDGGALQPRSAADNTAAAGFDSLPGLQTSVLHLPPITTAGADCTLLPAPAAFTTPFHQCSERGAAPPPAFSTPPVSQEAEMPDADPTQVDDYLNHSSLDDAGGGGQRAAPGAEAEPVDDPTWQPGATAWLFDNAPEYEGLSYEYQLIDVVTEAAEFTGVSMAAIAAVLQVETGLRHYDYQRKDGVWHARRGDGGRAIGIAQVHRKPWQRLYSYNASEGLAKRALNLDRLADNVLVCALILKRGGWAEGDTQAQLGAFAYYNSGQSKSPPVAAQHYALRALGWQKRIAAYTPEEASTAARPTEEEAR